MSKTIRLIAVSLLVIAMSASLGGCKLIFEPAPDAVHRLFKALATRDFRIMEELVEDEALRKDFRSLGSTFSSEFYKGYTEYWEVSEDVEVDESTGLSYVFVDVYVPQRNGNSPSPYAITFEMKRSYLRWTIYRVEGMELLLQGITRERGI